MILVIGDSCKDVFTYCRADRLCPDIPVPVLSVEEVKENPGMAQNVFRNISRHTGCDIITNDGWEEITKRRYVHSSTNHMFFRVDAPHNIPRVKRVPSAEDLKDYDLVVVSDYNKGFLKEVDIANICCSHKNVFLDTKKELGDWAIHAKYIKINDFEYLRSERFMSDALKEKTIRTVGGGGCIFKGETFPVERVEVKDSSGAGDTFLSALVVDYNKRGDIKKAIEFANIKASKVVREKGVTVFS